MFQLRQYTAAGLLLVVTLASAADCGERRTTRVFPPHTELFQVVAPDYPWTQVTRAPKVLAPVSPPSNKRHRCIVGEYERQRALLLACRDLIDDFPNLLADIVRQTSGHIEIILLVTDLEQSESAKQLLQTRSIPFDHVRFAQLPHDTMWARDYGPIIVTPKEGQPIVIDPDYDMERTQDDRIPSELGNLLQLPVEHLSLRLDGGNLLSNGDGLAITTHRLFDDNALNEFEIPMLRNVLHEQCGIEQLVVLEPLFGEPTGHADMFVTFVSKNVVLLGRFNPEDDPLNAEILDRNAIQLSKVRTGTDFLHVVRIDMPPHHDGVWRTYTNVIYANGVVLVPTYGEEDLALRKRAFRAFAKVLPQRKIVGIDASQVIQSEGALHCITMNLGPLGRLPDFPPPQPQVVEEFEFTDETEIISLADPGQESALIDPHALGFEVDPHQYQPRPIAMKPQLIDSRQTKMSERELTRWRSSLLPNFDRVENRTEQELIPE